MGAGTMGRRGLEEIWGSLYFSVKERKGDKKELISRREGCIIPAHLLSQSTLPLFACTRGSFVMKWIMKQCIPTETEWMHDMFRIMNKEALKSN
jgi:hypothetical protein